MSPQNNLTDRLLHIEARLADARHRLIEHGEIGGDIHRALIDLEAQLSRLDDSAGTRHDEQLKSQANELEDTLSHWLWKLDQKFSGPLRKAKSISM
jgi:hypothetical protein